MVNDSNVIDMMSPQWTPERLRNFRHAALFVGIFCTGFWAGVFYLGIKLLS